jgi:hypothetical protein
MQAIHAQEPNSLLPCPAKISRNAIGPSLPRLYASRRSSWKIVRYLQRDVCVQYLDNSIV